ncbi:MAG: hypothetical protein JXA82_13485 [Sedimentisphaerales bacterium]|nr:hypothetical protein [Sedimentisphaerales bacterium]
MSRWEKSLGSEPIKLLQQLGLYVVQVHRTALNGTEVKETLFSTTKAYIEIYKNRWEGQLLDKSPQTVRFEGFLFGYPPCCVEAYIENPYTPNDIDPVQQEALFHWACKGCTITPLLLPLYQKLNSILVDCD